MTPAYRSPAPTPTPRPTPTAVSLPPESSGTGRLWQIVSGVLAVALMAVLIMNFTNVDNGSQWKKRATTSEALSNQLQAKLKASEESAAELKVRTISLANEKAQAVDEQTATNINQKIADGTAKKLDACISSLQEVFSEISAATDQDALNTIGNTTLQDAYTTCDAAARSAEGFSQYLQNLANK